MQCVYLKKRVQNMYINFIPIFSKNVSIDKIEFQNYFYKNVI